MKEFLSPSQVMVETKKAAAGRLWIIEILEFIAIYFIINIAMIFVMLPPQFYVMFTDEAYLNAIKSADSDQIALAETALGERMASSDWFTILMLAADLVMILMVFLFCRVFQKRKLSTLGFVRKNVVSEYLIGMAAGFLFFSVCVGLGLLTGGLRYDGISPQFSIGIFLCYLGGFMIQGMAEEVLCRGYFMGSYGRRYPVYAAVLANSLLFAALHLLNAGISPLAFLNLVLFGVFASLYFIRRGSIWGIGAFHTVWNLVQGNFYGIKVSGNQMGPSLFVMNSVEGKDLFSGGAFGMEGSIICTLVYVLGIVWLLFQKNKDQISEVQQPV